MHGSLHGLVMRLAETLRNTRKIDTPVSGFVVVSDPHGISRNRFHCFQAIQKHRDNYERDHEVC